MNRISICHNAHLVYNTLGYNREWTYTELKLATGLSDRDLNAALGWLAHEGVICFGNESNERYISLGVTVYIG